MVFDKVESLEKTAHRIGDALAEMHRTVVISMAIHQVQGKDRVEIGELCQVYKIDRQNVFDRYLLPALKNEFKHITHDGDKDTISLTHKGFEFANTVYRAQHGKPLKAQPNPSERK